MKKQGARIVIFFDEGQMMEIRGTVDQVELTQESPYPGDFIFSSQSWKIPIEPQKKYHITGIYDTAQHLHKKKAS